MHRFLALCLALAGCVTPAPQPSHGGTGPTLVFEAGLGDGAEVWNGLRRALPADVPSFAWTRAGYGGLGGLAGGLWPSDRDGSRSGAEVAGHLAQALDEAGLAPPYILVAHSIGAGYALSFARAHPHKIAGIVLVDPRLPGFTQRCLERGLRGCTIPPLLLLSLLSATERLELRGTGETEAALRDLSALRDIPITILTARVPAFGEDPRWRSLWSDFADDFAARFARSRRVTVASGHYIQREAVDILRDEILRLRALAAEGP